MKLLARLPGVQQIDRFLRRRYTGSDRREFSLRGHFYSPLPDYREVEERAHRLFNPECDPGPSINLRDSEQGALLEELSRFYPEFDWKTHPEPGRRFHLKNQFFEIADALSLYGLLRHFQPRQVIEVGSGYSSALMLDVNDRFLNGQVSFRFIEPYPARLRSVLTGSDEKHALVMETRVQEVPVAEFEKLEANDFLFIDSSHVSKVGSDVNYLLFEVLPRLKPGVVVHIHDIMWPFEYPKHWIMEGRAWNEAYLVRAFLQYNEAFPIVLFNSYAGWRFKERLKEIMPAFLTNTGGSLWLRKC